MRNRDRLFRGMVILAGAAVVLAGCTSTKVLGEWKDDAYTGKPARVLVLGVTKTRGPRSLVEEEFVRQFKDRRVTAIAGTEVFPGEDLPKKEEVIAKAQELQVDAVMVARFLKKTEGETHTPLRRYSVPMGFATSWDEYTASPYGYGTSSAVGVRDVSYDFSSVLMETTVFDRSTGKPIWSAMTDTKYQDHLLRQIKPFVETIMKGLSDSAMLPKR